MPDRTHRPARHRRWGRLLAALAATALGSVPALAAEHVLVIRNVTLIDGTGRRPMPATDIRIEGKKIIAIGRRLKAPAGAEVIDGTGRFVIPGLIDAHVHLDFASSLQWTPEQKDRIVANNPRAFLYNGVTTVLNAGDPFDWIAAEQKAQREGRLVGPRIFSVGTPFSAPDGWGSKADAVASAAEARARAIDYADRGVDGFKVFIEGGLDNSHTFARLDMGVVGAITAVARARKLPVYVHAINAEDYRLAVTARPTAIMHGLGDKVPDGDPLFAEIARDRIMVVPTLNLTRAFAAPDPRTDSGLTDPILEASAPRFMLAAMRDPAFMARERANFTTISRIHPYDWAARSAPETCENARLMHRAGVLLAVGTDAGGPFGYSFQGYNTPWEVELLTECGLTPMEALVAATRNGAILVGAERWLGTVEKGKAADLLILDRDPLADIRNIRTIDVVVQDGVASPRARFAYSGE